MLESPLKREPLQFIFRVCSEMLTYSKGRIFKGNGYLKPVGCSRPSSRPSRAWHRRPCGRVCGAFWARRRLWIPSFNHYAECRLSICAKLYKNRSVYVLSQLRYSMPMKTCSKSESPWNPSIRPIIVWLTIFPKLKIIELDCSVNYFQKSWYKHIF